MLINMSKCAKTPTPKSKAYRGRSRHHKGLDAKITLETGSSHAYQLQPVINAFFVFSIITVSHYVYKVCVPTQYSSRTR